MMKRVSNCLMAVGFSASLLIPLHAATLEGVNAAHDANAKKSKSSQLKIDSLADKTQTLGQEFRQQLKLLEDLKVYNKKLELQTEKQIERLQAIENSIANVQVIQRQIMPLTVRMIDSLDDFIQLDMPFHKEERDTRISMLRSNVDRPDLTTAEKFRQVLEAYKIESEYGRKIDTYIDTVKVDGVDREVTVLRVGRIAMAYQTADMKHTGMWDREKAQYVVLDSGYKDAIRKGIRIANNQANKDILELPISAPVAEAK